jgi:cathepsin A (carboxypeptidase C)
MLIYLILTTIILSTYSSSSLSAGDTDEIHSLPGLAVKSKFRQYSGYLNATNRRHFHYWFVESQKDPQKDPVILWLNGGPGCSSLGGFWTENGPYRVKSDGKTLFEDPYSWNNLGNILYLESPAGVGYSYQENNDLKTDDIQTAKDNYLALKNFFEKFPHLKNNSFYITGESYAGVYIPMLALEILRDKSTINLKGLAIGNGAFDEDLLMNSRIRLAYYHGLIDNEMWNHLIANCCSCSHNKQECNFSLSHCKHFNPGLQLKHIIQIAGINPYNIYDDCHHLDQNSTDKRFSNTPYYNDLNIRFGVDFDDMEDNYEYYESRPKCISDGYAKYINSIEVRNAIHIPERVEKWVKCKGVGEKFNYTRQRDSMKSDFHELINQYKIFPFIVYNGDLDLVCDFLGDQQFVDGLGLTLKQKYKPWSHNGVTAGFVKRFDGLTFMTVRGAGHMVPTDKPEPALKIIKELLGVQSI